MSITKILSSTLMALGAATSSGVAAGTASFNGYGEVKTDPDYVQLTVQVVSQCYPKAAMAVNANDEVSTTVMEILSRFKNPSAPEDRVIASGGYVERYSEFDPRTNTPYCVNHYRKTNTIRLRSSNIKGFSKDFAEIQDAIYGLERDAPQGRIDAPTTSLTMGVPQTALYRNRFQELKLEALSQALDNAVLKFKRTFAITGAESYRIKSYAELDGIYARRGEDYLAAPEASGGAPISFDEITVSSQVQVEFEY